MADELLRAVEEKRHKKVNLFGKEIVVKTLPPDVAAEKIVELNKRAARVRDTAVAEGKPPESAEEIVDKEVIQMIATVISENIVEPQLDTAQREQLKERLAALPINEIGELMNVMLVILGTPPEAEVDVERVAQAIFRQPGAVSEGGEGAGTGPSSPVKE